MGLLKFLGKVILLFFNSSKIRQADKIVKKTVLDIIQKKLSKLEKGEVREKPDLLDSLLMESQKNVEGKSFTNENFVAETQIFLIAGSETTSNSLAFLLYTLAYYPDIQEKIYQEIMTVLGDKELEYDDLRNFEYLGWAISESMRLNPTLERSGRTFIEDLKFGNHIVKKGTIALIDMKGMHMNPRYWDSPNEFIPERFKDFDKKSKIHSPFGGGRRICVGKSLALAELQVTVISLLRKFNITTKENLWPIPIVDKTTICPIDLNIELTKRNK